MAETTLTQDEANALLAMEKRRVDDNRHVYPTFGGTIVIPLVSVNKREHFLLDIARRRINLKKATYQNRARTVVILARLDLGGPPHENPDGEELSCPLLHTYRAGFADKWAVPAPTTHFPRTDDVWASLEDFMRFCQITEIPFIEKELFL